MRWRSFRFRVAVTFAGFGALVCLLLCAGVYLYVHDMGQRLMDETLQAETQDYLARLRDNPRAMLPATLTLSGYILDGGHPEATIPPLLRSLAAGKHDVLLAGVSYRVLVSDRTSKRYVFLFNESLHYQRERDYLLFLGLGALVMTLLSALGGFWLARRIVAPVTALAARVAAAGPAGATSLLGADRNRDELEELAQVFDRYLERIQSCMARERDFTANVSHELRTPLAIIRGAVEVLEDDAALSVEQRLRLARIERASRDMAELTSALLHLAREESVQSAMSEHCDMAEVVRETVEKYRDLNQNPLPDVSMAIPAQVRLPVARTLAVVVVDNLLGNALNHSGAARIDIRLEADGLTIRDSGAGIAASDLDLVCQRHYRGANSPGAGIGLSLVKRICDLNGWEMRMESALGLGTIVSLLFRPHSKST